MAVQGGLSVFSFAYRPVMPGHPADGGFSVNLMDDDVLVYTEYDAQSRVTRELYFPLPTRVREQYLRMVQYASPWLRNVPSRMRLREESVSEYTFGFCGCPMFRIEDMVQLMDSCAFRSVRGHYTRLVYSLFEDISSILLGCGVDLQPSAFRWDTGRIQPLAPANGHQSHYA